MPDPWVRVTQQHGVQPRMAGAAEQRSRAEVFAANAAARARVMRERSLRRWAAALRALAVRFEGHYRRWGNSLHSSALYVVDFQQLALPRPSSACEQRCSLLMLLLEQGSCDLRGLRWLRRITAALRPKVSASNTFVVEAELVHPSYFTGHLLARITVATDCHCHLQWLKYNVSQSISFLKYVIDLCVTKNLYACSYNQFLNRYMPEG